MDYKCECKVDNVVEFLVIFENIEIVEVVFLFLEFKYVIVVSYGIYLLVGSNGKYLVVFKYFILFFLYVLRLIKVGREINCGRIEWRIKYSL